MSLYTGLFILCLVSMAECFDYPPRHQRNKRIYPSFSRPPPYFPPKYRHFLNIWKGLFMHNYLLKSWTGLPHTKVHVFRFPYRKRLLKSPTIHFDDFKSFLHSLTNKELFFVKERLDHLALRAADDVLRVHVPADRGAQSSRVVPLKTETLERADNIETFVSSPTDRELLQLGEGLEGRINLGSSAANSIEVPETPMQAQSSHFLDPSTLVVGIFPLATGNELLSNTELGKESIHPGVGSTSTLPHHGTAFDMPESLPIIREPLASNNGVSGHEFDAPLISGSSMDVITTQGNAIADNFNNLESVDSLSPKNIHEQETREFKLTTSSSGSQIKVPEAMLESTNDRALSENVQSFVGQSISEVQVTGLGDLRPDLGRPSTFNVPLIALHSGLQDSNTRNLSDI